MLDCPHTVSVERLVEKNVLILYSHVVLDNSAPLWCSSLIKWYVPDSLRPAGVDEAGTDQHATGGKYQFSESEDQ